MAKGMTRIARAIGVSGIVLGGVIFVGTSPAGAAASESQARYDYIATYQDEGTCNVQAAWRNFVERSTAYECHGNILVKWASW